MPAAQRHVSANATAADVSGARVSSSRTEATDEALMIRFQSRGPGGVHAAGAPPPGAAVQLRAASPAQRARGRGGRAGRVRPRRAERRRLQARGALLDLALHDRAQPLHRPDPQAARCAGTRRSTSRGGPTTGRARRSASRPPTAARQRRARRRLGARSASASLAAVDELPDEQREVFLMREVSNLPFKEIAEIVGVPGEHREEPDEIRARAPAGGAERVRGVRARACAERDHGLREVRSRDDGRALRGARRAHERRREAARRGLRAVRGAASAACVRRGGWRACPWWSLPAGLEERILAAARDARQGGAASAARGAGRVARRAAGRCGRRRRWRRCSS